MQLLTHCLALFAENAMLYLEDFICKFVSEAGIIFRNKNGLCSFHCIILLFYMLDYENCMVDEIFIGDMLVKYLCSCLLVKKL